MQNNQKIIKNWKNIEKHEKYQTHETTSKISEIMKNMKNTKNIKNIENITRGVGRLGKGKTPDSLPEPEQPNTPKTRTMVGLPAFYCIITPLLQLPAVKCKQLCFLIGFSKQKW